MRINTEQEKFHISGIKDNIMKLQNLIASGDSNKSFHGELLAMRVACNVYESLQNNPLPWTYECASIKECCHYVAAAMDLTRYLQLLERKKNWKKLESHLELLFKGGFGFSATYQIQQTKGSRIHDLAKEEMGEQWSNELARDAARKSIELMIALAAMNKFDEVILEDPHDSNTYFANPDVLIRHQGKRYGIACKSLSSKYSATFYERIEEAVRQIETSTNDSQIDSGRGIVFFDLSPLLDHDALYLPEPNHFWNHQGAIDTLQIAVENLLVELMGKGTVHDLIGNFFKGKHAAPCLVISAHSAMIVQNEIGVAPHYFKSVRLLESGDTSKVKKFVSHLNNAIHCQ